MNFEQLLDSIDSGIYENLKSAIELGKWPDGRVLSNEQRKMCLQAVIAYEHKHLSEDQRAGYIPPKPHHHCGRTGDVAEPNEEQPLTWKH